MAKPGASLTTIAVLPSASTHSRVACVVASEVPVGYLAVRFSGGEPVIASDVHGVSLRSTGAVRLPLGRANARAVGLAPADES